MSDMDMNKEDFETTQLKQLISQYYAGGEPRKYAEKVLSCFPDEQVRNLKIQLLTERKDLLNRELMSINLELATLTPIPVKE